MPLSIDTKETKPQAPNSDRQAKWHLDRPEAYYPSSFQSPPLPKFHTRDNVKAKIQGKKDSNSAAPNNVKTNPFRAARVFIPGTTEYILSVTPDSAVSSPLRVAQAIATDDNAKAKIQDKDCIVSVVQREPS
ncbi:hypothetical protein CVT26_013155 [Gymnopilus dilepis]|uniref:Uncharacterized protein n=1 Tax=Gymnopilus dilepis TaxID=231916 RepID=A0A409WV35_9AGAR|nr:hypothetical protein CVT26_013155 [Gymnopilus dilepis]